MAHGRVIKIYGAVAAAVMLAACSSNAGSSDSADGTVVASGDPIKVAFLSSHEGAGTSGDGYLGAKAAAKYINGHGGINGRPLVVEHCIDNYDANLAAACARKSAGDTKVIAAIGQSTVQGSAVNPIFEKAGLASVGAIASVAADFKSPIIFAPTIGGMSGLGLAAATSDLLGSKKIGLIYTQNPAGATTVELINKEVLHPRGLADVTALGISPAVTDLSPTAAKAGQSSPDGIVMYTDQAPAAAFTKAARQQGSKAAIVLSGAVVTPASVKRNFRDTSGVYIGAFFTRSGAFYDRFVAQWKADGKSADLIDDYTINGWLSATMFADVARRTPTLTRKSILDAIGSLKDYDTGGLLPPISFDKPSDIIGGSAPRMINPTIGLLQVKDGKFVPFAGGRLANPFQIPK